MQGTPTTPPVSASSQAARRLSTRDAVAATVLSDKRKVERNWDTANPPKLPQAIQDCMPDNCRDNSASSNKHPVQGSGPNESYAAKLNRMGMKDVKAEEIKIYPTTMYVLYNLLYKCRGYSNREVKVFWQKEQFGSYGDEIRNAYVKSILIDTTDEGKIDLGNLYKEISIDKKSNEIRVFLFSNPINPTQVLYSQGEVDEIAEILTKNKIDIIIEDLIFFEMVKSGHNVGAFFRTNISNKVATLYNISKYSKANLAGCLRLTDYLKLYIKNLTSEDDELQSSPLKGGVKEHGDGLNTESSSENLLQSNLLDYPFERPSSLDHTVSEENQKCLQLLLQPEIDKIILENCIAVCESNHKIFAKKCDELNDKLKIALMRISPPEYVGTNVAQLEFPGFKHYIIKSEHEESGSTTSSAGIPLSPSAISISELFKNKFINTETGLFVSIETGAGIYDLLMHATKTKTIPCELNNMLANKRAVRVILSQEIQEIDIFFDKLWEYLVNQKFSNKEALSPNVTPKLIPMPPGSSHSGTGPEQQFALRGDTPDHKKGEQDRGETGSIKLEFPLSSLRIQSGKRIDSLATALTPFNSDIRGVSNLSMQPEELKKPEDLEDDPQDNPQPPTSGVPLNLSMTDRVKARRKCCPCVLL